MKELMQKALTDKEARKKSELEKTALASVTAFTPWQN